VVANDKEEAGDVGPEVESGSGTSCPEMRWRITIYLVKNLGWRGAEGTCDASISISLKRKLT
jgi:hypothetical protein